MDKRFFLLCGFLFFLGLYSGFVTSGESWREEDVERFNEAILESRQADAGEWTEDPLRVALRFVGDFYDQESRTVEVVRMRGAVPCVTVFVADLGVKDDSICDYRHRISLWRTEQGYWLLRSAESAWRCQPWRGHFWWSYARCS